MPISNPRQLTTFDDNMWQVLNAIGPSFPEFSTVADFVATEVGAVSSQDNTQRFASVRWFLDAGDASGGEDTYSVLMSNAATQDPVVLMEVPGNAPIFTPMANLAYTPVAII